MFALLQDLHSNGDYLDPLFSQKLVVNGEGWSRSAADVVLSSAGWVSVTLGGSGSGAFGLHAGRTGYFCQAARAISGGSE